MAIHDEGRAPAAGGGLALASLVTGIVAIFACGLGLIAGPVAVILGIVSGRRSGYGGKQVGGIVTGAFAFVVSAIAVLGLALYISGDDEATSGESTPVFTEISDEPTAPTADAEGAVTLTEAGVAASGFDTAYAAFLDDNGVTDAFDGMYGGDPIETPCFTIDGEAWWVVQGSPETCQPASELWWEAASGDVAEVKLFGSGSAGAGISFEGLSGDVVVEKLGSADLATVAAYARDTLLPDSGATDIVETPIELGGLPAVQLDCTIDGMAAYRIDVVMLPETRVLDSGATIDGFIIHAYNEAEWIYGSEDVFARLDNTLVWK